MNDIPSSVFMGKYPLVYPLADAMLMDLDLTELRGQYTLRGEFKIVLDTLPGVDPLDFTVQVKASYVGKDSAGVLLKVRKKLYAYLDFDKPRNMLYFTLIDADKIGMNEANAAVMYHGMPPAEAALKYEKGIVALFQRGYKSEQPWTRVDTTGDESDADTVGSVPQQCQEPVVSQEGGAASS